MKKMLLLAAALLCVSQSGAQNRKVNLQENVPLEDILAQARAEKKLALLDFGSPSCKPCLFIKKSVFTVDSVADFINERFVSVDYNSGPEKERLSKIYGVYTEPVILIVDREGRMMHRMEGSCTPAQMLERLRQGLDPQRNLVAQDARYGNGDRAPDFLAGYMNTLSIAGYKTKAGEVLANIFSPGFEPERLEEEAFWRLFADFNESPVSREAEYVFRNRRRFYELYGEETVNAKIDRMFEGKVRTYTYGQSPPAESEEFLKILNTLQHTDYPKATQWLIYLMPAQYKFRDWPAMARAIQAVIDLNIPKGSDRENYFIMMARQISWYSDDKEALGYALGWLGRALAASSESARAGIESEIGQIKAKLLLLM